MNPRLRVIATLVSIAFPFLAGSPAALAQSAGDEALVASAKAALEARPELDASQLTISSKNAEVTLAGPVEDGAALYQIGLAVQKVPGVKYVINDMMPRH